MKKYIIFLILVTLFNGFSAISQQLLKGNIVDEATNKPLAFATIYLNTTSIGKTSDDLGNFQFKIPEGEHRGNCSIYRLSALKF